MSEVITKLRHKTMRAIMLGYDPKHAYLGGKEYNQLIEEMHKYQMHMRHSDMAGAPTTFEGLTIHEVKEESYMGVGN